MHPLMAGSLPAPATLKEIVFLKEKKQNKNKIEQLNPQVSPWINFLCVF